MSYRFFAKFWGKIGILIGFWFVGIGESRGIEDESTKNAWRVADHYSARSNQTLEQREASPIIHLKKLNNWVGL